MITLPAICCNTSPTPIGLSPGFLSNDIKRIARNAFKYDDRFFAVHNFLIKVPQQNCCLNQLCYLQIELM